MFPEEAGWLQHRWLEFRGVNILRSVFVFFWEVQGLRLLRLWKVNTPSQVEPCKLWFYSLQNAFRHMYSFCAYFSYYFCLFFGWFVILGCFWWICFDDIEDGRKKWSVSDADLVYPACHRMLVRLGLSRLLVFGWGRNWCVVWRQKGWWVMSGFVNSFKSPNHSSMGWVFFVPRWGYWWQHHGFERG